MRHAGLTRREFVQFAAGVSACAAGGVQALAGGPDKPNILWITSEDNGPHLGCYGDAYADTPNLDGLAAAGMIYERAWSNAPVCAPARTTIISGVYPPALGAEHMRSQVNMPPFMKMYPQFLREAGYYCTNNSKEDYNLPRPAGVWDESSGKGHWRNRAAGQPFFAIFNFTTTHESQIRRRPHKAVHDSAKVRVPAYHPDTPEVRQDWAQYHDKMTEMDAQAGKVLAQLKDDGLADDTIVFYYGDHGPGMPRSKRWPYNSGLRVPLILHIPEKFKHLRPPDYAAGGKTKRLVGFIDLAPTLLSLVGIRPPEWMQGHAFAGRHNAEPQAFLYGFRGRMDERYDMVRSVTDGRYVYLRHYMPHKIYGQYISYMFQTPTTQKWKALYDAGELNAVQKRFWESKPAEELYDLESDADEVNNLAASAAHQDVLKRLRRAQQDWAVQIRDIGFLPEDEIHTRSQGSTPYEMGHNPKKYPLQRIIKMAEVASSPQTNGSAALVKGLKDADSAVRYWAAIGMLIRGTDAVEKNRDLLLAGLSDASPNVRAVAAQALGCFGADADAEKALAVLVDLADVSRNSVFVSLLALNAIDDMGIRAASSRQQVASLPAEGKQTPPRMGGYVVRLLEKARTDLGR
ncbi:MAG: sulfatase-like hydrolase/transferase [Phycisphaerae bacterium]|nr:sulfatase-like hydrolase/transferase [Phycisphaerae bacterium]